MATYSSVLAWRIPGTGEPGGLPFLVAQSWTRLKQLSSSSGSIVKNTPANAGDSGSIPGLGSFLGGGNCNPLQYSCLGNLMDRRAWRATAHGIPKELDMT